jgi:hypothetical protein
MLTLYIPDALSLDTAAFLRVLSLLLMAYAVLIFGFLCFANSGDWRRLVALFLGLAFWLPTVIGTNPAVALTWFAHPFQYLIMVAWVSGRRGWGELAIAAGYALLTGLYSAGALLAFSALAYGVSQAHFLIDGEVWRRGRAVV